MIYETLRCISPGRNYFENIDEGHVTLIHFSNVKFHSFSRLFLLLTLEYLYVSVCQLYFLQSWNTGQVCQ